MTAVLAHRGAWGDAPENTLASFRAAVHAGVDGVELDVRRTADGALAVHHDAHLLDGRLLAQVVVADLPGYVPLLDDALDACEDLLVNVEIKNLPGEPDFDPEESVATAVARLVVASHRTDRVVVSSFNLAAVDRVRAVEPAVPTALLALVPPDPRAAEPILEVCRDHGHAGFHPHHLGVTAELVARCHASGLACRTWTVDHPDRLREVVALGVDAVITNHPAVALEVLGRR